MFDQLAASFVDGVLPKFHQGFLNSSNLLGGGCLRLKPREVASQERVRLLAPLRRTGGRRAAGRPFLGSMHQLLGGLSNRQQLLCPLSELVGAPVKSFKVLHHGRSYFPETSYMPLVWFSLLWDMDRDTLVL